MPHSLQLRIADMQRLADSRLRGLWEFLVLAKEAFDDLSEAANAAGGTDATFAEILFDLPRTPVVQLDVAVDVPAVGQVTVSAPAGSGLFASFRPGRSARLSGFVNGGNNASFITESVGAGGDSIVVTDVAAVTETGSGDEEAKQEAYANETSIVTDYRQAFVDANELYQAFANVAAASQADRKATFERVTSI